MGWVVGTETPRTSLKRKAHREAENTPRMSRIRTREVAAHGSKGRRNKEGRKKQRYQEPKLT